jgi:predicted SAM-dependent methyltransferase
MVKLMKRTLRRVARAIAPVPVIGRFVNIGAVIIRLPQFYQAYLSLNHQQHVLEEKQRLFETQQLPNLLQTVAEINHRQVKGDTAKDNLAKSVPIALRNLTRDSISLKEHLESFSKALENQSLEIDQRLGNHSTDIDQLFKRIEFVRRELMFEMRYGASKIDGNVDNLRANTEIISPEKLATAKNNAIKINLGCGHVPLDGYLNVDRRALPGVDIVAEVDDLPFEANELDEIFSAHLIEHFPQEELKRKLLPYWLGLLKPGGMLRAVVPDADGMINAYKSGEYDFDRLRDVTYGGQDYDGDFHYNMLNISSMTRLLQDAGFEDIIVLAENRENAGCKEFEISAKRKIGEPTA